MIARLTVVVALMALVSSVASAQTLRVLNWQGYGTDETFATEAFEDLTGIPVVHEYFNSEQEMLTKLRTNPGAYDVVLINSAFTGQAAQEGLIQAIDTGKIENAADLIPEMAANENLRVDGAVFGIPWVWGATSFAINTSAMGDAPTSIEALWSDELAGRIGIRDDAVEAVQLAAIALGQDINNPSDMAAIREKLRALKPQIRTFWSSENEWNQFMASGEFDAATYWSGSAARSAKAFGLPVEFVIPEEGAIGWLDGLSIPTDAPNRDAAHQFINWMIDPDFYVKWDTDTGAPAPTTVTSLSRLPDTAFNRAVMGDPEVAARLKFTGPMDDATREAMLEVWQETKTYFQE